MSKKDENNYNDNYLKNLLKGVDLEEPSDDFTKKVMDGVMQEWLTKPVAAKKPLSRKGWLGAIGATFFVVLILLATDVRTIISMLDNPLLNRVDSAYLQPINEAFGQLFQNLINMPVIVYVIFFAVLLLTVLDRLLLRIAHYR